MSRERREKQQLKAALTAEPPLMRLWRDLGKVGWVIAIFFIIGGTAGDSSWMLLAGWIAAPWLAWVFPIHAERKKQFLGWTVFGILLLLLIQATSGMLPPICGNDMNLRLIHPNRP